MIIYLLRHAQSYPQFDVSTENWPLSPKGDRQAGQLVSVLESLSIDKVYSSPYKRCLDTIKPFIDKHDIPCEIHDELRECHVTHKFMAKEEFLKVFEKSWEDFSFCLEDGESCQEAQKRIVDFLNGLEANGNHNLLLSSHGNLIGLLLNHIDRSFGSNDANQLMNPDIKKLKIGRHIEWDRSFDSKSILCDFYSDLDNVPVKYHHDS
ncbi:MAG: histidine phosphatase family protein [Pseudobacteriovorax sp.]|nr:histidine phosphatase family protein [Pseudobacteriovorax sp.]